MKDPPALENGLIAFLVGSFGHRESNRQGSVFGEAAEMIENLSVCIGCGVMRFVNDDGGESGSADFSVWTDATTISR